MMWVIFLLRTSLERVSKKDDKSKKVLKKSDTKKKDGEKNVQWAAELEGEQREKRD